ncbi:MAG: DUF637 domain-containing protein [Alcanivoracaceae bacterium]|nr:DUF637 domain-containing protein [Alcanivoracaceae bacterium]
MTIHDRRMSLVERGLAAWLSFVIVAQPLVLHATEVLPADGNTTLDLSANGTRIVNIATPSASGLSHNRYGTFNVSEQGVILNNSREVVRTDIGGYIEANPHLAPGSASLILNEVVSANPSSLLGAVEVGGQQADVVIANPNGITCNGCGFINTVRGTLTTGTPQLLDGALTGFDIRGGSVDFEGAGANMQDADRFDVLAGAIRLNAEIQGHELNLVAGHHQVAYSDLSLTANDATPDTPPEFAISSSSVGGIYGDRIRLIANDAGVGVHLDAPVAAQLGSVEIDADGALRFTRVSAADDVAISAHSIVADGAVTAGDRLDLVADADIHLAATPDTPATSEARRIDIQAQSLQIDADAAITGRLLEAELESLNNSGVIRTDVADIQVDTTLANQGVIEGRHLTLDAADLDNADGSIAASGRLGMTVDDYIHRGEVQAAELALTSANDIVVGEVSDWRLAGDASFVAGGELRNEGILSTTGMLLINADTVSNTGSLAAQGDLSIEAFEVGNDIDSLILAGASANLRVDNLYNAGDIYAVINLTLSGLSQMAAAGVYNEGGLIGTQTGDIHLHADQVTNTGVGEFLGTLEWTEPLLTFPETGVGESYNERCFLQNRYSGCRSRTYRDSYREQFIPEDQLAFEFLPVEGVILAGGNLDIQAHVLTNLYSLLGAHGTVDIAIYDDAEGNGGTITNSGYDVALEHETRTDSSWYVQTSSSWEKDRKYTYTTIRADEDPETCNRYMVRCGRADPQYAPAEYTYQTVVAGRIAAGGNVNISGVAQVVNGVHENDPVFTNTQAALRGDGLADSSLYRLDPLVVGGFALPGRNGLFVFNGSANHPYLIETNPLFASHSGFMGSSYMLDRLGWNPEPGQRLLGDSFYELNLLQNSLMGQPVLAGTAQQDREQFFTLLMDQGIAAAESLELSVGVSLSAEQINALQSDIIWLEEREVAGYKVLVPVVYLANGIQPPDALIAGQAVDIKAGSISSSGTIRAQENLTATASDGSITNTGSMLAGETLSLTASEDIVNRSGLISGGDVALAAEGDIRNETAFEHVSAGRQNYTMLGDQARIEAAGKLTLDSGNDVFIRGSEISAEQLDVQAGGNIQVDTIEIRRSYNMDGPARNKLDMLTHLSADISSALDTLMRAEQDIVLAGAQLAGGTDVSLFAGNDLRIEAVQDRYYSYLMQSSRGTFSKKKKISEHVGSELIGTQIQAGGQLTLDAEGGEVAILASTGHGEQGVTVNAGTDVRIESGINTEYERTLIIKKNAARVKTKDKGSHTESLAVAGLSSGGDLDINADGNMFMAGAALEAGDALRLGGVSVATDETGNMLLDETGMPVVLSGGLNNIIIDTVALEDRSWNVTTRELRAPIKAIAEMQNFIVDAMTLGVSGATGIDANITIKDERGHQSSQHREEVSTLAASDITLLTQSGLYAVGTELKADNDILVSAGGDVIWDVASTQTVDHRFSESDGGGGTSERFQHRITDTNVQGGTAEAGGNLTILSGGDIQIVAGQINAAENVSFDAGGQVSLLAAYDYHQELIEDKRMGEFGTSNAISREQLDKTVAVVTEIAASNISITSKGNQTFEAASLSASEDITLDTEGQIIFASTKDVVQHSVHEEDSSLSWQKVEGAGSVDETIRQTQLQAAGNLAINAAQGIQIDIVEIDQASVSEMIDAMVAADPQLAWLKEMEQRGDVDWQQIKEVHDSWDYESQGMGPGLALAVTIVVTTMTGGAGANLVGAIQGAAGTTVTVGSAAAAGVTAGTVATTSSAMAGAVISSAASTLTVSTINNGGKLDRALSDLGGRDSLEGLATSGLTAGVVSGFIDPMYNEWQFGKASEGAIQTQAAFDITKGFQLNSWQGMTGFALHNATQGLVSAGASAAIQGGSFNDYLRVSMENQGNNVLSALAYNQIGNLGDYLANSGGAEGNARQFSQFIEGGIGRVGLHSVAGGLITEATGGDFATGAAAAGLNQWLSPQLDHLAGQEGPWRTAASQLAGLAGAMMVGGDVNDGAWIAKQADTYNRQLHSQELKLIADNYKQYAAERGISEEQALKELVSTAYALVDESFAADSSHRGSVLFADYDEIAAWQFLTKVSYGAGLIRHQDGEVTRAFVATNAQKYDPMINRDHLFELEYGYSGEMMGLGRKPILNALSMNLNAGSYYEALQQASAESQSAMIRQPIQAFAAASATAFATPALTMGVLLPGAGLTAVGYVNNGAEGALDASFGYGQMVAGVGVCSTNLPSCMLGAPMAVDGLNGLSKGVFFNPSEDVNSLFTYSSDLLFNDTSPGLTLELASTLMNIIKTPAKIAADPKGPDMARDLLGGMSDLFLLPDSFMGLSEQVKKE